MPIEPPEFNGYRPPIPRVPKPPTVPAPVLRAVMAELVRREVMG